MSEKTLDERVLAHLRDHGGSTAWAMRAYVGERSRPEISKALQRLKRKGLVRVSTISHGFWKPVQQAAQGQRQ